MQHRFYKQLLETSEKLDQTDDGEAEMGEKAECTRSLPLPGPAF